MEKNYETLAGGSSVYVQLSSSWLMAGLAALALYLYGLIRKAEGDLLRWESGALRWMPVAMAAIGIIFAMLPIVGSNPGFSPTPKTSSPSVTNVAVAEPGAVAGGSLIKPGICLTADAQAVAQNNFTRLTIHQKDQGWFFKKSSNSAGINTTSLPVWIRTNKVGSTVLVFSENSPTQERIEESPLLVTVVDGGLILKDGEKLKLEK